MTTSTPTTPQAAGAQPHDTTQLQFDPHLQATTDLLQQHLQQFPQPTADHIRCLQKTTEHFEHPAVHPNHNCHRLPPDTEPTDVTWHQLLDDVCVACLKPGTGNTTVELLRAHRMLLRTLRNLHHNTHPSSTRTQPQPNVEPHNLHLFINQLQTTAELRDHTTEFAGPGNLRPYLQELTTDLTNHLETWRTTLGTTWQQLVPMSVADTLLHTYYGNPQTATRQQRTQHQHDLVELAHRGADNPDVARVAACHALHTLLGTTHWPHQAANIAAQRLHSNDMYVARQLSDNDLGLISSWYLPHLVHRVQQHLKGQANQLLQPHTIVLAAPTSRLLGWTWPLLLCTTTDQLTREITYMSVPGVLADMLIADTSDDTPLMLDLGPTTDVFDRYTTEPHHITEVLQTATRQVDVDEFPWQHHHARRHLQACAAALT